MLDSKGQLEALEVVTSEDIVAHGEQMKLLSSEQKEYLLHILLNCFWDDEVSNFLKTEKKALIKLSRL